MIEVLAYFELRIIHTSDRKCDSPFESVEKRHGCVWVACQSNMHMCCLRFLCMCSARYYRWKWLEGHTSSAPQNTILRSSHSYTDFVAWFARIVTGKHLCTVIWDAHFKLRFATWFGMYTHSLFCVFWKNSKCASQIKIQNTHFAVVWKQSKKHCPIWHTIFELHVPSKYKVVSYFLWVLQCVFGCSCVWSIPVINIFQYTNIHSN